MPTSVSFHVFTTKARCPSFPQILLSDEKPQLVDVNSYKNIRPKKIFIGVISALILFICRAAMEKGVFCFTGCGIVIGTRMISYRIDSQSLARLKKEA